MKVQNDFEYIDYPGNVRSKDKFYDSVAFLNHLES